MKPLTLIAVLSAALLAGCQQLPAEYLTCGDPKPFCYRANTVDHEYSQFHYGPRPAHETNKD